MGLPSMTSLLRSKSSLKSSQKSVAVKARTRRTDEEEQEDTCEVQSKRRLKTEPKEFVNTVLLDTS